VKMNCALLGNLVPHLHWHLIPRHADDPNPRGAIWEVDRSVWASDKCIPSSDERDELKQRLLDELKASNGLVIVSTFRG
jgi:diadenosine tetraphosphate (Ap4A) HIT family hydrolase